MRYIFHPEADEEFEEAIEYYEARESGLGLEFAAEVHYAIQQILSHPNAWQRLDEDIRRCQIRRFPYGVVYSHDGVQVHVLAVMHLRRNPSYWKLRKRR